MYYNIIISLYVFKDLKDVNRKLLKAIGLKQKFLNEVLIKLLMTKSAPQTKKQCSALVAAFTRF